MKIQTELLTFKNLWKITSSYDCWVHQQHFQRRYYSHTALQWFKVIQYLSQALSDTPLVVARPPIAIQIYHHHYPDGSDGYYIGSINSGIWPPRDSGSTTPKYSQGLTVTKTPFGNHNLDHGNILQAVQPSRSPRFEMLGLRQLISS